MHFVFLPSRRVTKGREADVRRQQILATVHALGLRTLDLYPVFLERSRLAALFYHHYSEDGYRLVGEQIADYLSRSGHPRSLASSRDR